MGTGEHVVYVEHRGHGEDVRAGATERTHCGDQRGARGDVQATRWWRLTQPCPGVLRPYRGASVGGGFSIQRGEPAWCREMVTAIA